MTTQPDAPSDVIRTDSPVHDDTAPTPDHLRRLTHLILEAKIGMLTTMTSAGRHVSRPMALQEAEFDGDLWFFTYADSKKVREITTSPSVNVAFANDKQSAWTSISGEAVAIQDNAKASELWSAPLKAWFPEGLETPGLTLLKISATSAEWWDSPRSKVVRLVGMVTAAATGDPNKFPGDTQTLDLEPDPADDRP
ncbi:MAG: pyridoxamine 5'-phosphate oxidase family protein [Nocardioides sp.]